MTTCDGKRTSPAADLEMRVVPTSLSTISEVSRDTSNDPTVGIGLSGPSHEAARTEASNENKQVDMSEILRTIGVETRARKDISTATSVVKPPSPTSVLRPPQAGHNGHQGPPEAATPKSAEKKISWWRGVWNSLCPCCTS